MARRGANAIRQQRRRGEGDKRLGSDFGGHATCDVCVVSAKPDADAICAGGGRGLLGQRHALIVVDLGAGLVGFYPTSARGSA
eukprot:14860977-Alexandrium_andersonii.AAC.1